MRKSKINTIPAPSFIKKWLRNEGMLEKFETFSSSQKREIIEYIQEVKREETKVKKIGK